MTLPDQTKSEARVKNTKEQYEALGRFVEAFEDMVDDVRMAGMDLLSRLSDKPTYAETHRKLLHIVFHHQALTAKPLFEIMRSMVAETLKSHGYRGRYGLAESECATFCAVVRMIGREYGELVMARNNLLHAQWGIGFPYDDDPDGTRFFIFKGNPNKDGWATLEGLPSTASELLALSKRCQEVSHWMELTVSCLGFRDSGLKIVDCFEFDGKQWRCVRSMQED